ncbi:serine/threonine protein kinase [Phaeosphaeriaceae sp. PMI808]|nr:serine/threonine protein kinase [Phaeosphaeriaceae sp. PMI808]
MASLFRLGQLLKGRASTYTITKQLHESIWLAANQSQTVAIKSACHFRLENERDNLKRFQSRTHSLRPLINEIEDPSNPPALVLKHLGDDLLNASAAQRLSRLEIKHVAKKTLEALKVLHEDDIKPDNVLVNYGQGDIHFADVELADCGNTVRVNFVFRSSEAQLQMGWGTPTDIWSPGTMLIALIWGANWFIFKPDVPADHGEYELKILMKQHQFFGPLPLSYKEIADDETLAILIYVMHGVPPEKMKPFGLITEQEISKEDKAFILKIMIIYVRREDHTSGSS